MPRQNKRCNIGKDNPFFGKTHTEEAKEKVRQAKLGDKNPNYNGKHSKLGKDHHNWQEDYTIIRVNNLHRWLRKRIPKPQKCEVCNIKPPLDLANITGVYNRDFANWQYQCRKCHMMIDGRIYNLMYVKEPKGALS